MTDELMDSDMPEPRRGEGDSRETTHRVQPRPTGTHTYSELSKSEQRRCPTCNRPVALGFGRPKTYCQPTCRAEMAVRRQELDELRAELDEARDKAAHESEGTYWRNRVPLLERQVALKEAETVETLRPGR